MSARRLRLEVSELATDDLRSIQAYTLDHWGPVQATAYEESLHGVLEMLLARPGLGRARDDIRSGLQSYPVASHVILYRIDGDTLMVLRILHQRMDVVHALLP